MMSLELYGLNVAGFLVSHVPTVVKTWLNMLPRKCI